jgi:hypothetical protein
MKSQANGCACIDSFFFQADFAASVVLNLIKNED